MPCENCHVQFSVFKRKRSCLDCRRFYCSNCLSLSKLCERCLIFSKRPLLKTDLLPLKPKDLIFYLQSKHISTAGCVEKDELIGLVLHYAQQTEDNSTRNSSENTNESRTRFDDVPSSFSSLKQTCQNFFANITENINDSFSAFDSKQASNTHAGYDMRSQDRAGSGQAFYSPTHIFDQPRISTREIPTYASYQTSSATHSAGQHVSSYPNMNIGIVNETSRDSEFDCNNRLPTRSGSTITNTLLNNHDISPTTVSPEVSVSSTTSHPQCSEDCHDNTNSMSTEEKKFDSKADCECFDEEFIASFNERRTVRTENDTAKQSNKLTTSATAKVRAATTTTASIRNVDTSISATTSSASGKIESKVNGTNEEEGSSQSSFEELGAIGGMSDSNDSKTTTDTNSNNMEQWQILDTQRDGNAAGVALTVEINDEENGCNQNSTSSAECTEGDDNSKSQILQLTQEQPTIARTKTVERTKKVTRRRSDGYINHRVRPFSDEDSPTSTDFLPQLALIEQDENESPARGRNMNTDEKRQRVSCARCGKNKTNIKQHVAKMRRHLECAQIPEADIKDELNAFLAYLEKRTNSVEYSDSEPSPVTAMSNALQAESSLNFTDGIYNTFTENDDGIHVYASSSDYAFGEGSTGDTRRFINLDDFDSLDELECLTVKQLKEVLMLNRVDYKGCCEKKELLERVERLWKNLKSTPGVEKLPTDELCKICMDAPIECVILECGHMATCTNCGKILSECPICRQYIVRVVRFFRA